jgi:hypothetical protein
MLNLAIPLGAAIVAELYPTIADYSHTVVTRNLVI